MRITSFERTLIALSVVLVWPAASVAEMKIAVLPLQPHIQAKDKDARFIEKKLLRELGEHKVTLVTGDKVAAAMKAVGAKDTLSCDTQCLLKIGRKLGVDRVLAPDLSLQRKVQSVGTVWLWSTRQVNVKAGKDWGFFRRMCMCHVNTWNLVASRQVKRMLNFDPAKVLRLKPSDPRAKPTKGPRDEPGMVYVPAGAFIMGSTVGEFDEEPRHRVELDAFYIDKYEVTNGQYNKCIKAGKCGRLRYWHDKNLNKPEQAVIAAHWYDAQRYCKWVGKRLPTEAEWEKAARGTDERWYPWGNDFDIKWVNMHHDKDGFPYNAPPGSFPKNVSPYGAYDMAGNAWEWTADYWNPTYYRRSPVKNPKGPEHGARRVMRGGGWMYDVPFFVTTHNRSPGKPTRRKMYVGFRCAKDG